MHDWFIPPISSPIGLVGYILLIVAIVRISHRRIQKQIDPGPWSAVVIFLAVALSVSLISISVNMVLTWITWSAISIFYRNHGSGFGESFIVFLLAPQVFFLVGVIVGYFAGPSFSELFHPDPPTASSDAPD